MILENRPIAELERFVRDMLHDRPTEIDLAFSLLELSPALGVVFGRSSLGLDRHLDAVTVLAKVEEALDDLGMPPEDRFQDIWDQLQSEDDPWDEDEGHETDQLRARLLATAGELHGLRDRLKDAERQLAQVQAPVVIREPVPVDTPVPAVTVTPENEAELKRLRNRLSELKQLLKERNRERTELRQQLLHQPQPARQSNPDSSSDEQAEPGDVVAERYGILVPEFGREALREITALATARAAQCMRIIGQLCASDEPVWKGVKYLQEGDCYSVRLGLHHRLLFRMDRGQRRLQVEHVIPRTNLDLSVL